MFTVNWPRAARFEAALVLPVAVLAAGAVGPMHAMAAGLAALVAPQAPQAGLVRTGAQWLALGCLMAIPYAGLLIAIDRLLAVRKGLAILSVFAVAAWAGAAYFFAAVAGGPAGVVHVAGAALPLPLAACLAAGALALLVHARALKIGLRDRGFVGTRLAAGRDEANTWRRPGAAGGRNATGAWVAPNPRSRRPRTGSFIVRRALPWGLVFAAAYNVYVFRFQIAALGRMVANEAAPHSVAEAGPGEAIAPRGGDGLFTFDAVADGIPLRMVYDPAATFVTLRAADAQRLGLVPRAPDYAVESRTANGFITVAPITLNTLRVGNIWLRNVQANVARPGELGQNILGQSFLSRLAASAVVMDRLVLKSSSTGGNAASGF